METDYENNLNEAIKAITDMFNSNMLAGSEEENIEYIYTELGTENYVNSAIRIVLQNEC